MNNKLKLTVFKNIYDNKTHRKYEFDNWGELVAFFRKLSVVEGYKPKKGEWSNKTPSPLISPAFYEEDTTRANKNVIAWSGWCALDVDDYDPEEFSFQTEEEFKKQIIKKYGKYDFVCYSTASSTFAKPKFRLVYPLTDYVYNKDIKDFWYALNTEIGSIGDKQTKDLSRLFYVPANYPNAFNFFIENNVGERIDPKELIAEHPNTERTNDGSLFGQMCDKLKQDRLMMNLSKCDNVDVHWTSYRDCPFVNKKQIVDYSLIMGEGWYRALYEIMVTIAGNAKSRSYPITSKEIEILCKEIDRDNGGWYQDRPIELEARRAIEYVFSK